MAKLNNNIKDQDKVDHDHRVQHMYNITDLENTTEVLNGLYGSDEGSNGDAEEKTCTTRVGQKWYK